PRAPLGEQRRPPCRKLDAVDADVPRSERKDAREGGQQRRLAGAVRADDDPALAGRDADVEAIDEDAATRAAAGAQRERFGAEQRFAHRVPAGRCSSIAMNVGTPIAAARTPTGSRSGAARTPSRRSACGTTRPTKPIAPAVATAAPVASAAASRTARRRGPTATPSVAAH